MTVEKMEDNEYIGLFGPAPTVKEQDTPLVFANEKVDSNLFAGVTPKVEETPVVTTVEEKVVTEEGKKDEDTNTDILSGGVKEDSPKYEFSDIAGYFEDRIKNGTFVAIEDEIDGAVVPFIPKTPEEFDEVLQIQVDYKVEAAKKELNDKWYEDKSPAWKFIAEYAEKGVDPSELLPLLQGVQTIQSIDGINEQEVEGAEQIVRFNYEQKGFDPETIATNIESLKATDKLIQTAERMKPQMLKAEQQHLAQLRQEQETKLANYRKVVDEIRDEAIKSIEAPIYGTSKLANDEKALIYDMIAYPAQDTKGYKIYDEIDKLYQNKDFNTLTQVALLLGKKDSFFTHIGVKAAQDTSTGLQRKLRAATDARATSGITNEEPKNVVTRNQYTANRGTAKFGRG